MVKDCIVLKVVINGKENGVVDSNYTDKVKRYFTENYGECEMLIFEHCLTEAKDEQEALLMIWRFRECNAANRIKQSYNGRYLFNYRVYTNFIDIKQYRIEGLKGVEFSYNPVKPSSLKKKKNKTVEMKQREWMVRRGLIDTDEVNYDCEYLPTSEYFQVFYNESDSSSHWRNTPPHDQQPHSPFTDAGQDSQAFNSSKDYHLPSSSSRSSISGRSRGRTRSRRQTNSCSPRQKRHCSSSSSLDKCRSLERESAANKTSHKVASDSPHRSYDKKMGRLLSYKKGARVPCKSPSLKIKKDNDVKSEQEVLTPFAVSSCLPALFRSMESDRRNGCRRDSRSSEHDRNSRWSDRDSDDSRRQGRTSGYSTERRRDKRESRRKHSKRKRHKQDKSRYSRDSSSCDENVSLRSRHSSHGRSRKRSRDWSSDKKLIDGIGKVMVGGDLKEPAMGGNKRGHTNEMLSDEDLHVPDSKKCPLPDGVADEPSTSTKQEYDGLSNTTENDTPSVSTSVAPVQTSTLATILATSKLTTPSCSTPVVSMCMPLPPEYQQQLQQYLVNQAAFDGQYATFADVTDNDRSRSGTPVLDELPATTTPPTSPPISTTTGAPTPMGTSSCELLLPVLAAPLPDPARISDGTASTSPSTISLLPAMTPPSNSNERSTSVNMCRSENIVYSVASASCSTVSSRLASTSSSVTDGQSLPSSSFPSNAPVVPTEVLSTPRSLDVSTQTIEEGAEDESTSVDKHLTEMDLLEELLEGPPSPLADKKVSVGIDFHYHKFRTLKEFEVCSTMLITSCETLASHNPEQAESLKHSLIQSLKILSRQFLTKFRADTGITDR